MTIVCSSSLIKSKEKPAKDVLSELLGMCKGVQHPTRSLFLRSFLLRMCRDKLPEKDNEYIGNGNILSKSKDSQVDLFMILLNSSCPILKKW
jgi:hypothetical protein